MLDLQQSIVQEVHSSLIHSKNIRLFIKRDDLLHAEVSGNKWRKLKYSILHVKQQKLDGILTFGGAFSNHLVATAAACKMAGLKSIGFVRGEELTVESNETLKRCAEYGMKLHFLPRSEYDWRNEKAYQEQLSLAFPLMFIVPEGGANYLGMIGCQEILKETSNDFDYVVLAQGTTTTSNGVLLSLPEKTKLWVVPSLKGFDALSEMKHLFSRSGFENEAINDWLEKVEVLSDYHFGGYAKYTNELLDFIDLFYLETGVALDPVYTGKAMFGLLEELKKREVNNARVLFIHTGGLQGAKAIFEKAKRSIF